MAKDWMDRATLAANVSKMYAVSDYTGQITLETCDPGGVLNREYSVEIYTYDNDGNKIGKLETFKPGETIDVVGKVPGSNNEYVVDNGQGKYAIIDFDTADYAGKNYENAAMYVQSQHGGAFNFQGTSGVNFNEFIEGMSADSKQRENANANSSSDNNTQTDDSTSFANAINAFGEQIVVPGSRDESVYPADDAFKILLEPTVRSYGLPPQWTKYVDPRVGGFALTDIGTKVGLGRRYMGVTISNPTVLEIAPGFMKYTKWLTQDTDFLSKLNNFSETGDPTDLVAIFEKNNSTFYTIQPCFSEKWYSMSSSEKTKFAGYMSYVNVLMQVASIFLSKTEMQRNGTLRDQTTIKYKSNGTYVMKPVLHKRKPPNYRNRTYDRADWTFFDKPTGHLTFFGFKLGEFAGANHGDKSTNTNESAFDFIRFYLTGNTTATDEFQTSVEDSFLGGLANTVNAAMKETAYWLDSVGGNIVDSIITGAKDVINSVSLNGKNPLQGLSSMVDEMVGGGKLVFPKIITDSAYGKSIHCECTFPAIYGDEEAIYLNSLRGYLHLLAFVLPHQTKTSIEMYTYPFIVKAFCRGLFNVEMGAITSFSVQRGGTDNALWSFNGASENITVDFEITPLINNLVMTSSLDGPGWMLKNKGLQEYLSTIAAYDSRNDRFELGVDIFMAMWQSEWRAKGANIFSSLAQSSLVSSVINTGRIVQEVVEDGGFVDIFGDATGNIMDYVKGMVTRYEQPKPVEETGENLIESSVIL